MVAAITTTPTIASAPAVLNLSEASPSASACGEGRMTPEFEATWTNFTYWCEGVLTCGVGTVGLVGNVFSISILATRELRKHSFNQLLIALSLFDLLFIICAVPVHAMPVLASDKLMSLMGSRVYGRIYQYFLYPFTTVAYMGSVYMTVAITIERYIAVKHPLRYRELMAKYAASTRTLIYVIPVTICALVFNIPRFLEIEASAELRIDPNYLWWYTHSMIIHPFITTIIGPIVTLCVLNYKVYRGILHARTHVQSSNNHGEMNLALVFTTICAIFFVCHILRIILAVESFSRASFKAKCVELNENYVPPMIFLWMESVSSLLILTNSSCNFIVYCTRSTHFKVFMKRKMFNRETCSGATLPCQATPDNPDIGKRPSNSNSPNFQPQKSPHKSNGHVGNNTIAFVPCSAAVQGACESPRVAPAESSLALKDHQGEINENDIEMSGLQVSVLHPEDRVLETTFNETSQEQHGDV